MDHSPDVDIIEALRVRKIRAMRSALLPGWQGVALSVSVFDLERFLDILVPPPMDIDDVLAPRIIGRPQDMGPDDEPWQFELLPGVADAGFEFHAIVNIPEQDVALVLARLNAN